MTVATKLSGFFRDLTTEKVFLLMPFVSEYASYDIYNNRVNSVSVSCYDQTGGEFTFTILVSSQVFPYTSVDTIALSFVTSWKSPVNGNVITRKFSSFDEGLTGVEIVKTLCDEFLKSFRKPESRGSVKVYLDDTKKFWFWKRPNSNTFLVGPDGEKYLKKTCNNIVRVYGHVEDGEDVFLTDVEMRLGCGSPSRNTTPYVRRLSQWFWKDSLVTIYENMLPFDSIACSVTADEASRYEFIMMNGERRYVNVRRNTDLLTGKPIHGYSTRIEQLIPVDKLFRKGKTDLYAKRPQEETPFIGFELEACTNKSEVGKEKCAITVKEFMPFEVMCKSDGSISPDGFETVSIPGTLDYWKESSLSSMLDAMRSPPYNMRSFEHKSCGFHAHVSRSALSVLDLQKMERFMNNPTNKDFLEAVAGRSGNNYQKYNPSLFTDRKSSESQSNSGNSIIEGLTYLGNEAWVSRQLTYHMGLVPITNRSDRTKLAQLAAWVGNTVSYSALGYFAIEQGLVQEIQREFGITWSSPTASIGSYICNALREARINQGYSLEVVPATVENRSLEMRTEIGKKFFLLVASKSPHFARLIKPYFTDWDWSEISLVSAPKEKDTTTPAWKLKPVKSSAPYQRVSSYNASQMVKGPVGKSGQRYDVLNTNNRNTVEFRLFKGTLNPSTVFRYIEFVDALVRFVPSTSATNEGVDYKKFVRWLVGDSFNVIRYEHLVSFITEKGYLDRKEIRKKTLPTVAGVDSDITTKTTLKPVGFNTGEQAKPLGEFNTGTPVGATASTAEPIYLQPVYEGDEYDEGDEGDEFDELDYDEDEDEDYVEESSGAILGCDCVICTGIRNR